jgi:ABC-type phosphate transport system substrate-binding protein
VSQTSLGESETLREFVRFALENAQTIAEEAQYVPMSQQQIDEEMQKFEDAVA